MLFEDNTPMKKVGLQSLELKALSVPSSLRFLLGVEYDVVLCVTEVGNRRSCTIRFPLLATTFRTLLELCAERFGLKCTHYEDHSVLTGTAAMPLLRYIDYLPGALHMDELLSCLRVTPITSPVRCGDASPDFIASFIDYTEYPSDASLADVHGTGFYLTLDYGLSIATHSHLIDMRFHGGCGYEEALREFSEFSGWNTFDMRFYDENDKRAGGVVVMSSIQDACDVFEKYEDEDSDDEGDLLPFVLRPVCPLVPVPCVEDSALKKLREQHWGEIEKFWELFPKWHNCVVLSNLYDTASLAEALTFFEGLQITDSSLVEDNSPAHRRRVFVTFANSDDAKRALLLDGKSTKGKTLRVQVSPPYMDESRRGRVVGSHASSLSDPTQETNDKTNPNDHSARPATGCDADAPALAAPVTPTQKPNSAGAGKAPHSAARSPPLAPSTMNANAREFVPSSTFQMNANSPEYYPAQVPLGFEECIPPPPAYAALPAPAAPQGTAAGGLARAAVRSPPTGAAPPPYTPPPPYILAGTRGVALMAQSSPPTQSL